MRSLCAQLALASSATKWRMQNQDADFSPVCNGFAWNIPSIRTSANSSDFYRPWLRRKTYTRTPKKKHFQISTAQFPLKYTELVPVLSPFRHLDTIRAVLLHSSFDCTSYFIPPSAQPIHTKTCTFTTAVIMNANDRDFATGVDPAGWAALPESLFLIHSETRHRIGSFLNVELSGLWLVGCFPLLSVF